MNPNNSPPEEPSSAPFNRFLSEARVRELLRIEEECGCDIGAGRNWGIQMGMFLQDPIEMERLAQLRDWLLSEFRLLLSEWKLGRITDTLLLIGQQLLIERFRQPPPETQELLWHLFEQSQATQLDHSSAALPRANDARTQVRALIARTLTSGDWQALTQAAVETLEQYLSTQQAELNRED
ncbi:hypothetical protein H6F67_16905 [Microcoleus sp. FACHB-1515]|uniref:hypothetical protein n=1 Tax=Cyanophyceae TaxID=3028117 RepID=UPI0016847286|nr:hypothetical protein [Microcoleus sp. FACHB-1515]MBD2091524.1 hypothetical protein [Microcoleus sp. FACHB-1515]